MVNDASSPPQLWRCALFVKAKLLFQPFQLFRVVPVDDEHEQSYEGNDDEVCGPLADEGFQVRLGPQRCQLLLPLLRRVRIVIILLEELQEVGIVEIQVRQRDVDVRRVRIAHPVVNPSFPGGSGGRVRP